MKREPVFETLKRFGKPIAAAAAVGVVAFVILWRIQYASPRPLGTDIYYHLKFAQLTAQNGLIKEFPWCQFSLFKDHFADKEFLFHFLLVPFVKHDLYQAGKLFPIWVGAALTAMLYAILRYHKTVYPWLWLILLMTWTPTFLYRFSMPRPHLLAIFIFVAMTHALIAERRLLLFAVSCLYPLTHSMAVLIWVMPLLYELNRLRIMKRFEWRTVVVVVAGLAVGFLFHPNFPNNLRVLFIQAVTIPKMLWLGSKVSFGMEFRPFDTRSFLMGSYLPLGLNAVALFLTFTRRYDLDRKIGFLVILNLIVFGVTMMSKRFIEFLVPVNVLFLGLVFSRQLTEENLEALGARLGIRKILGAALLVSAALVLSGYHNYNNILQTMKRQRMPNYRQAAMTLHRISKPRDIVFTGDWDDMPQLFFYNHKNYYMNVLDPAFMYCWNEEVWRQWQMIVNGVKSNTYRAIREDFRSRHVFATSDMQRFLSTMMRDPRFELVHHDRACGVFRLKDGPFDDFVSNWTFAGPFAEDADEKLRKAVGGKEPEIFRIGHSDEPSTITIDFQPITSGTMQYGYVDLLEEFSSGPMVLKNVVAYARAVFDSPTSGPALVHFGFDDGGKAWLNGENIFHDVRPGSAVPNEHVVKATLRPGENVMDVKVFQMDLDWGFYCWLTDEKNAKVLVQTEKGWVWKDRKPPEAAPSAPETSPDSATSGPATQAMPDDVP